jgi:large subunit ribosomal protein L11
MQIINYNEIDLSKVIRIIDLIVPAQKAQLGPPVGPALSQARLKAKDFCDIFNNTSKKYKENFPLCVKIFVFSDKRFNFLIKTPSIGFLLKNVLKTKKIIHLNDVYKIAKIKKVDMNYLDIKIILKNVLNFIKLYKIKIKK